MANRPIPITAKTEEKSTTKSCARVPNINGIMMSPINNNVTETYLLIKWIRAKLIPLFLDIFVMILVSINLTISKKSRRNPVAINASLWSSKNVKNAIVVFFCKDTLENGQSNLIESLLNN